ncbi:MAG: hypothetical protein ASARMPREDX12_000158 [Alectoria sarmentosa]|nr:MAG: hypothetical protein ASARMPREDX12_000158 [Alectoria sarmentosa]
MAESAQEMQRALKRLMDTSEVACKGSFKESEIQRIELPTRRGTLRGAPNAAAFIPADLHRKSKPQYLLLFKRLLGQNAAARACADVHSGRQICDVPGLKKEAARRFDKDVEIPGDSKCEESLTLLSVVPHVYATTPDSDRGLRDLVVRHVFQRAGQRGFAPSEKRETMLGEITDASDGRAGGLFDDTDVQDVGVDADDRKE